MTRRRRFRSRTDKRMITRTKSSGVRAADPTAVRSFANADSEGFGLIESLMAVLILALGFMFVAPLMVNSIQSITLAKSKDTAGLAAANQLENLASQYRANASAADLTIGDHGPNQVEIVNPSDSSKVNRYNVAWTVSSVPDLRAGKTLKAVQVRVTVTPIGSGTATNIRAQQNKVINVTTIFSLRRS